MNHSSSNLPKPSRTEIGGTKRPQSSSRVRNGRKPLWPLALLLIVAGCCVRPSPTPNTVSYPLLPPGEPRPLTKQTLDNLARKWVESPTETTMPNSHVDYLLVHIIRQRAYIKALKAAGRWSK